MFKKIILNFIQMSFITLGCPSWTKCLISLCKNIPPTQMKNKFQKKTGTKMISKFWRLPRFWLGCWIWFRRFQLWRYSWRLMRLLIPRRCRTAYRRWKRSRRTASMDKASTYWRTKNVESQGRKLDFSDHLI